MVDGQGDNALDRSDDTCRVNYDALRVVPLSSGIAVRLPDQRVFRLDTGEQVTQYDISRERNVLPRDRMKIEEQGWPRPMLAAVLNPVNFRLLYPCSDNEV